MFIDTHCHIHSENYLYSEEAYKRAINNSVEKMINVGTDISDSRRALDWAKTHKASWAAIGVHPHEAKYGVDGLKTMITEDKVIAIGEIGLDYYYHHSDKKAQTQVLEQQIELALEYDLPIIFHIRDAFDDFWPIFYNFRGIKGVLHSFTDTKENADKALTEGLYIGVNGISTFTKDKAQQEVYRTLPLDKIILETDAPYLTPVPYRGRVNEPAYVKEVAEHLSQERSTPVEKVAIQTTHNATHLFQI